MCPHITTSPCYKSPHSITSPCYNVSSYHNVLMLQNKWKYTNLYRICNTSTLFLLVPPLFGICRCVVDCRSIDFVFNNQNLGIKTKSVTAGANATLNSYIWLFLAFGHICIIWPKNQNYASALTMRGSGLYADIHIFLGGVQFVISWVTMQKNSAVLNCFFAWHFLKLIFSLHFDKFFGTI